MDFLSGLITSIRSLSKFREISIRVYLMYVIFQADINIQLTYNTFDLCQLHDLLCACKFKFLKVSLSYQSSHSVYGQISYFQLKEMKFF